MDKISFFSADYRDGRVHIGGKSYPAGTFAAHLLTQYYNNVSSMKKIKLKEWKIPIKTVIMVITTKPKTESKGIFHGRAINTDIL